MAKQQVGKVRGMGMPLKPNKQLHRPGENKLSAAYQTRFTIYIPEERRNWFDRRHPFADLCIRSTNLCSSQ